LVPLPLTVTASTLLADWLTMPTSVSSPPSYGPTLLSCRPVTEPSGWTASRISHDGE